MWPGAAVSFLGRHRAGSHQWAVGAVLCFSHTPPQEIL
jgi:hypothetical protein